MSKVIQKEFGAKISGSPRIANSIRHHLSSTKKLYEVFKFSDIEISNHKNITNEWIVLPFDDFNSLKSGLEKVGREMSELDNKNIVELDGKYYIEYDSEIYVNCGAEELVQLYEGIYVERDNNLTTLTKQSAYAVNRCILTKQIGAPDLLLYILAYNPENAKLSFLYEEMKGEQSHKGFTNYASVPIDSNTSIAYNRATSKITTWTTCDQNDNPTPRYNDTHEEHDPTLCIDWDPRDTCGSSGYDDIDAYL